MRNVKPLFPFGTDSHMKNPLVCNVTQCQHTMFEQLQITTRILSVARELKISKAAVTNTWYTNTFLDSAVAGCWKVAPTCYNVTSLVNFSHQ